MGGLLCGHSSPGPLCSSYWVENASITFISGKTWMRNGWRSWEESEQGAGAWQGLPTTDDVPSTWAPWLRPLQLWRALKSKPSLKRVRLIKMTLLEYFRGRFCSFVLPFILYLQKIKQRCGVPILNRAQPWREERISDGILHLAPLRTCQQNQDGLGKLPKSSKFRQMWGTGQKTLTTMVSGTC